MPARPSSRSHPLGVLLLAAVAFAGAHKATGRELHELVDGWSFRLESDATSGDWQPVSIPHDWSISLPRAESEASGGGGGYFQTGQGRYRYELDAPRRWIGQRAFLDFEGVYRNAVVSVNGQRLAEHAYGYSPFSVDITEQLRLGESNRIEVLVDNSAQPNSRWYTGSGIYRPVSLRVVDPIHIAPQDVAVSTWYLSEDRLLGTLDASAAARNLSDAAATILVDFAVIDPAGLPVARFSQSGTAAAGEQFKAQAKLAVPHPQPWSPDSPRLYRLVARSFVDGRLTDRQEVGFGIRTLKFSAKDGFRLNDEPVTLFGGNVHHDHGPLGAASFRDAEFRKARLLKEAGFNAVRTAHNPPSSAFLDACDTYGLLVIDEAFDGWKSKKIAHDYGEIFEENWRDDLAAMILRDRNHPSVIMWSIGNEVYERGKESGIQIAANMAKLVKEIDPTRPVTAGLNGLGKKEDWPKLDRLFSELDVVGYNYELARHQADHERVPSRILYSSESYLGDAFATWQTSRDRPYALGDFVWSAIDYLGEAGIGRIFPPDQEAFPHWEGSHYPWHGAACGDIDLTGWRKPISHYRNIVWDRGEKLYAAVLAPTPSGEPWNLSQWAASPLLPSWTWPQVKRGAILDVEVYSRYPETKLLLNGKSLGVKPTGEQQQFKAVFKVPYKEGKITALGLDGGQVMETFEIATAKKATAIKLSPEPKIVSGSARPLRFVQVQLADASGNWNPSAESLIEYSVQGPAKILAIGSGQLDSEEPYGANPRRTFQGKSLVVLEVFGDQPVTLTATADTLAPATVTLNEHP